MSQPTITFEQAFTPLTREQFKNCAPSAFTNQAIGLSSDKYVIIPTHEIVSDLESFGWFVSRATQNRVKLSKNDGFQKHYVHLRNPNFFIGTKDAIETIPEILIINSYNARCRFKMMVGMFRVVCANGLIVNSSILEEMSIPHRGYRVEELFDLVPKMLRNVERSIKLVNIMKSIDLDAAEQRAFAIEAVRSRWDYTYKLQNIKEFLEPLRVEDESSDLWTVFNKVQEKLVKGGWRGSGGRTIKSLKNYDREVLLNNRLYEVVEHFIEKKSKNAIRQIV